MFPSNAAAAKRLGKRKVREITGGTSDPYAAFNPHGHHFSSPSIPVDGRRSKVQNILNNAAAAAAAPFSYMALLTSADQDHGDDDVDDYNYESCPISKDIHSQSDQIDQMIMLHSENLRQSVLGMVEKHHHSLHRAAEERAAKRLRVCEAKLQEKSEQNAELERLAKLYKEEAERLLLRVRYLERAAMSLSEGLQEAHAARRYAETEEEEAESSFEDPDRVGPVRLDCKVCERQLATVMVWPCRHVCVCTRCNAATKYCPVCRMVKTTSVEVSLPLD